MSSFLIAAMQADLDKCQGVGESCLCVYKESITILQGLRFSSLSVESGIAPHLSELEQWLTDKTERRQDLNQGRLDHPVGACAEKRLAKSKIRFSPGATVAPGKQGTSSGAEQTRYTPCRPAGCRALPSLRTVVRHII